MGSLGLDAAGGVSTLPFKTEGGLKGEAKGSRDPGSKRTGSLVGTTSARAVMRCAKLRNSLERLLAEPRFRNAAQRIGQDIRMSVGTRRAADIIEDAVAGKPAGTG